MTTVYEVKGMTCGHCVESVTKAMQALPGVTDVTVDLDSGRVEVASDPVPQLDDVRTTIEEIGFELVG
ncbi:MAG TPA: cation transporter [Acidimicrobiales bacterium]|nr:cation transporter [Acidimicrobiales bacterium]